MNELGMVLSADYLSVDQIISLSPLIDQMGYTQVSVPEIWGHDAISLLSALALKTKNVKLATGIINLFSRSAALIAMTAASLDELSRGRLILGLGLSGPRVIERWHGIPFSHPLTRTREYIQIIRKILARKRLDDETKTIGNLKGFSLSFKPIREHIPIHLASLGPKNVQLTAEIADGWIPVLMPLNGFAEQVERMKKYLEENGRRIDSFAITPFVLTAVGTDPKIEFLLRGHAAYYFGGMGDFYNNMLQRMGFEEEAKTIKRLWLEGKRNEAAQAIPQELLDETTVRGTREECLEKLAKIEKAGATCPLITLPFGSDADLAKTTIEALAPVHESL